MACNAIDIPALSFPRNEIIEITPASYNNEATRIPIPGVETSIIASSPEDIKIPVPPSGTITPMGLTNSGTHSPQMTNGSPRNGLRSPAEPVDGHYLIVNRAQRQ